MGEAILLGEMAPLGGHCRVNGGTFVFMSAEREREDDDAGGEGWRFKDSL